MTASPRSAGEPAPTAASAALAARKPAPGAHPPAWDRRYSIAMAALMLCLVALFSRHLFTSAVLYLRDVSFLHYPHALELRSIVRSGHVPLWNPWEHFGEPIAANPIYAVFYPPTWLAWLLPAAYGFKLNYVLHFFLFAAGAFLLARRCGASPVACFAAGGLLVLSGPVMSLGNVYNHLAAAAWTPFALIAADHLGAQSPPGEDGYARGWLPASLLLAVCMAVQVFTGSGDFVVITGALVTAWVLGLHAGLRQPVLAPRNRALFTRLGAAALLAAGLSALQVAPALRSLMHSDRAAGLPGGMFWSAHPLHLVSILLPDFWGAPLPGGATPWLLLDGREPFLYSPFIGLITVVLAAFALLLGMGQGRVARWWAVIASGCIIAALGRYTPAGHLFYDVVPVFKVLRYPAKLLVPAALALTQLAAIGIDRMLACGEPLLRAKARVVSRALIALALAWAAAVLVCMATPHFAVRVGVWFASLFFNHQLALEISAFTGRAALLAAGGAWLPHALRAQLPYIAGVAILFTVLSLRGVRDTARRTIVIAAALLAITHAAFVNYDLNGLADPRMFSDRPLIARFIGNGGPPPRVYVEKAGTMALDVAQVAFLPQAAAPAYAYRMNLEIGAAMNGIETPWSIDVERVLPREQELLEDLPRHRSLSAAGLTRLLQLSATEYAVLTRGKAPSEFAAVGVATSAPGGAARVYRVPGADARAWLVPRDGAVVARPGPITIARLIDSQFDPRRDVVLDSGAAAGFDRDRQAPQTGRNACPLRSLPEVRRWDAGGIELRVAAGEPCYVVVAAAYDPDWRVYVDGTRATMLRANQMFRAVLLGAGSHDVRFVYRPVAVYAGGAISLFTLFFVVFGWLADRRKDRLTASGGMVR